MRCGRCREHDLDLVATFEPVPDKDLFAGSLPRMRWGKEILPLCPCCSTAECPHKQKGAADAR